MKALLVTLLALVGTLGSTREAHAQGVIERFAVVTTGLGGVSPANAVVLREPQVTPTTPEPTRSGGEDPFRYAVTGRNRLEFTAGVAAAAGAPGEAVVGVTADLGVMAGLQYTRYLGEHLALTVAANVQVVHAGVESGTDWSSILSEDVIWLPIGLRWNPLSQDAMHKSVKPYLTAGLGPVVGLRSEVTSGPTRNVVGATRQTVIGGLVGAGVDVHLARSFTFGFNGGYNWMADFGEPLAGRDNYSGFDFGVSVGWLFGRGSTPRT